MKQIIIDEDLQSDEFFAQQQRRLKFIIENVSITQNEIWYDAGLKGGRVRTYLEDFYNMKAMTSTCNLNSFLKWEDKMRPVIDSNTIDVITHFEVIEHLFNYLTNMQECYRILKPGGRMYLTTPNDHSLIYKLEHLLERKYEPHFHQFTRNDLLWLLTVAGFQSITIRTFKRSNTGKIARFCNNSFFVEARK